jgi:hypothetical protein
MQSIGVTASPGGNVLPMANSQSHVLGSYKGGVCYQPFASGINGSSKTLTIQAREYNNGALRPIGQALAVAFRASKDSGHAGSCCTISTLA